MFAYELARDLGIWDVEGMLEEMPCHQFAAWAEFYRDGNSLSEQRADLRMGTICAVIGTFASAMGKRKARKFKPADFIPSFGRRARNKSDGRITRGDVLKAFIRSSVGASKNGG